MKKNTKKKLFTLMLVIMLLSIAVVGGSLAWFTAEDEATNVFTVGTIGIEQIELNKDGNAFTQNQMLFPVISTDYDSVENDPNFIYKKVSIDNTGSNPAYVRTWIAIPTQLIDHLHLLTNNADWHFTGSPVSFTLEDSDVQYTAYCYVYGKTLSVESTTEDLLTGVYLDAQVDIKDNPDDEDTNLEFCKPNGDGTYNFTGFEIADAEGKYLNNVPVNVLVATQAVQVKGFARASVALNTAFGVPNTIAALPNFN